MYYLTDFLTSFDSAWAAWGTVCLHLAPMWMCAGWPMSCCHLLNPSHHHEEGHCWSELLSEKAEVHCGKDEKDTTFCIILKISLSPCCHICRLRIVKSHSNDVVLPLWVWSTQAHWCSYKWGGWRGQLLSAEVGWILEKQTNNTWAPA